MTDGTVLTLPPLPSDLYARANHRKNAGPDRCHWCGAACERNYRHDEPPPIPFVKTSYFAKCPNNAYICTGCYLYRQQRRTVRFLRDRDVPPVLKDSQAAKNHSWFITEEGAWALAKEDYELLYDDLLHPPRRFVLSLLEGAGIENCLHRTFCNDVSILTPETRLVFTLNNIPHWFTPYELEEGLRTGTDGREPGVRALIALLGPKALPPRPDDGRGDGRGRPTMEQRENHEGKQRKKVLARSGG